MHTTEPSSLLRPRWWNVAHAIVGSSVLSMILTALFQGTWEIWALLGLAALILSVMLQWQMGRLDAARGRGCALLGIERILASSAILCALTTVHNAFGGAFVALPLAVGAIAPDRYRTQWASASALGVLFLWGTPLASSAVWAILLLTLGAAASTRVMFLRGRKTDDQAEDSPQLITTKRTELLLQGVGTQRAQTVTTERLHEMVSIVRAATRGQFAAVYWMDDAQSTLLPAVIETATPQKVYDGPIAIATAFPQLDLLSTPLQEHVPQRAPAWYLETSEQTTPSNLLIAHIQDEGILLGVLLVERPLERGPYHAAERIAASKCAHLAALQRRDEQAAISAAKTSHDLQVVAHAAEQLSDTLNESEVYRIGATLFGDLVPEVDVAFVRQTHEDGLEIAYLSDGWKDFHAGDELPSHNSMVALAIDRRHTLPYRAGGEDDDPTLFGIAARNDDLRRHLICPLISGRIAHSAVVLRVPQEGVFHRTARERLGLLSNQIAAALGIARAYETMAQRASHDGMTQLLNRTAFQEQSALALQRAMRSERPLSVLILDIDHFKSVNDTYGHAIGDDVIRAVAKTIRAQVRRIDIAARYGGEEFVVILEDTDIQGAHLFAERLRERIANLVHQAESAAFHATISLGLSAFPDHATDVDTLVEYADMALYESKRNGRNRVTIWTKSPETHAPSA